MTPLQVQSVPHSLFFGLQIAQVVGIRHHFDRNVADNLQAVSLQADTLDGIVSEEFHLLDAELAQNLGSAAIVTLVGLEAEVYVGFHRVEAFFLQFIGGNLVHQSDAAAFLLHIYHDALAFLVNLLHSLVELFATVAAQ